MCGVCVPGCLFLWSLCLSSRQIGQGARGRGEASGGGRTELVALEGCVFRRSMRAPTLRCSAMVVFSRKSDTRARGVANKSLRHWKHESRYFVLECTARMLSNALVWILHLMACWAYSF